jgi:hypothetical protein
MKGVILGVIIIFQILLSIVPMHQLLMIVKNLNGVVGDVDGVLDLMVTKMVVSVYVMVNRVGILHVHLQI